MSSSRHDYRRDLALFTSFFRIGLSTIGGGYAMIPMMQQEVVDKRQWLSQEEFLDIMAVAQATPGIFAVDMASHIGYKLGGLRTAIVAVLGNILPSIAIILLLAIFFRQIEGNLYVERAFRAMRPVVVALIAVPVFSLAKSAKLTASTLWIPILVALAIWLGGISPIWLIALAGLTGFLVGRSKLKAREKGGRR